MGGGRHQIAISPDCHHYVGKKNSDSGFFLGFFFNFDKRFLWSSAGGGNDVTSEADGGGNTETSSEDEAGERLTFFCFF